MPLANLLLITVLAAQFQPFGDAASSSTDSSGRTTHRDALGRTIGTSTTDSSGRTTHRDALGRTIGTSSTSSSGQTTYRDSLGRTVGSSSTNSSGQTTYRDALGRTTGTSRTNSSGQTTYRDSLGRTVGTSSTSSSGQTTYRDSLGRTTGSSRGDHGQTPYRVAPEPVAPGASTTRPPSSTSTPPRSEPQRLTSAPAAATATPDPRSYRTPRTMVHSMDTGETWITPAPSHRDEAWAVQTRAPGGAVLPPQQVVSESPLERETEPARRSSPSSCRALSDWLGLAGGDCETE